MKLLIALVTAGLLGLGAGGRADEKKKEAKGTLTLGEKKYALAHAIAYENTGPFKMKETVVILTEKPLDTSKLKASFKKNGNDEDFYPAADHIKLIFGENDKGKLTQLAIQAGGGAVIRQGDKNIRAEATVKDGSVKGTAGTVKADKVRDKLFEFDVEFEIVLIKP